LNDNEKLLLEHFKKELELSIELLSLLTEEEGALSQQDIQHIPSITSNKNNLILKFLNLKSIRQKKLSNIGLPRNEPQIGHWIKQQQLPELHQIWENLLQTLRKCQHINLINGKMIQQLTLANRAALQLLVGKDPTQSIYGPGSEVANTSKFNIRG
jgi:flagellar biosynthesis/type III secretory pathway chaperone